MKHKLYRLSKKAAALIRQHLLNKHRLRLRFMTDEQVIKYLISLNP